MDAAFGDTADRWVMLPDGSHEKVEAQRDGVYSRC